MGIGVGMGSKSLTGIERNIHGHFGWGIDTLFALARKLEIIRRARRVHEIKAQKLRDDRLISKARKRKVKGKAE